MNEQEIVRMYVKDNKSTYEISKIVKSYPNKIRRLLLKHGVKLKDKSQAQKNALKQGKAKIPTAGQHRTKEEKIQISRSMKKRWENISEEKYQEHVDRAKARWYNMSEEKKKEMSRSATNAIQIAGKEGSKLEKFLQKELTSEGYKIEMHKKDLIVNQNLEIDLYIPELKTIIEVDGPSHFFPICGEEKLNKQIKSDENKTGLILSKGLAIIRIKNLSDSVALSDKYTLKQTVVDILTKIKRRFPPKSERYIEIEL